MRRWFAATAFVAVLLGCSSLAPASVVPSSLTVTLTMDCSTMSALCNFNPGSQGSPEQGMANFSPVAPGWSASFDSAPAISWGVILDTYQAGFGTGGSFTLTAPGGMQLSGMLTSGVAFLFPRGTAETAAWFQGNWNNGLSANGVMVWDDFDAGAPVTLNVTTYAPEPASFFLLASALAVSCLLLKACPGKLSIR